MLAIEVERRPQEGVGHQDDPPGSGRARELDRRFHQPISVAPSLCRRLDRHLGQLERLGVVADHGTGAPHAGFIHDEEDLTTGLDDPPPRVGEHSPVRVLHDEPAFDPLPIQALEMGPQVGSPGHQPSRVRLRAHSCS